MRAEREVRIESYSKDFRVLGKRNEGTFVFDLWMMVVLVGIGGKESHAGFCAEMESSFRYPHLETRLRARFRPLWVDIRPQEREVVGVIASCDFRQHWKITIKTGQVRWRCPVGLRSESCEKQTAPRRR